jgi:putative membrane protein insertion efficiency factor
MRAPLYKRALESLELLVMGLARRAALALIRLYQLTLSYFVGGACRHLPTCSHFAADAIGAHGLWIGGWMTLGRLWRCRPGGSSGWDPVPAAAPAARWWAPWTYGDWRGGVRCAREHGCDHASSHIS